MVFPGTQGGPLMHLIALKAVTFKEALEPDFVEYQKQISANARAMVAVFIECYDVVPGGTDDHLFLVDPVAKGMTGKDAALSRAHIAVNKNAVPNDPQSLFVTSGIRIGTPAITTRGFNESDAVLTAALMCDVLDNLGDSRGEEPVRAQVAALCARLRVYAGL